MNHDNFALLHRVYTVTELMEFERREWLFPNGIFQILDGFHKTPKEVFHY